MKTPMLHHRRGRFAALAGAFLLLASAGRAVALPAPSAASYSWGAQLTVAGYDASKEALSDFPVLVRLSPSTVPGFQYSQMVSSSTGADLCFIDMSGNGLPFEIDTWDPNGTSLVWVKLPTMTNGAEFVMCWGSATSGKTVCPDNPFAGYKGVWHMDSVDPSDSSPNGFNGTHKTANTSVVSGPVGAALNVPRTSGSDGATCGSVIPNPELTGGFTVEGWCRPTQYGGMGDGAAMFGKKQFISIRIASDSQVTVTTPGKSDHKLTDLVLPAVNTWWHWAVSFKMNTGTDGLKLYVNGQCVKTMGAGDITDKNGTTEMFLGNNEWDQAFKGDLDEMRLSVGLKSADWIYATYATQNDAAFLTAGSAMTYEATAEPQVGCIVSSVQYTNATLAVSIGSLGMDDTMTTDASWVDATVLVATDDAFANTVLVLPLDRTNEAPASVSATAVPLVTNTVYWAKVVATNSLDVTGESVAVSFTTRNPGFASGSASFLSRGFTTLAAQGAVADFGVGSASATMRLEASSDGFATVASASAESAAALGEAAAFTVESLTPGTDYSLRVRIVNEWGLETFVPVSGTYATRAVPIAATGIGYVFSADGSTVAISFGVSSVFAGATCTAALEYGDRTLSSRTFSSPGTLSWTGVPSAGGTATATVTVTATVDGTTYTQSWTATVTPGTAAHVVSSLPDLANVVFHVGDSATLPEPAVAGDHYLPLDVRVFGIGTNGVTLTALEPGFSAVCAMEWDAAAGAFVRNAAMGLAVCVPEAEGRVFLAEAGGANMSWSETAKWRCLSDPTVTGEYPNGAGDVAMLPLSKDRTITLDVDAMVGAVYVGWDATVPASGTIRFAGANKTLAFDSGEKGVPGLFRITGLNRSDVNSERPNFTLGSSGSGSRLVLAMPKGLVLDGGKHPDVANTTLRNVNNRINFRNGYGNVEVPAGKVFSIVNMDHAGWSDGQMYNCSTFIWGAGFPLSGSGTVVYDTAALGFFDGALKNFAGTLVIRQKQRYTAYGVDSRGGGFWLKANVGYAAENATFVVEGESVYASNGSYNSTLGLATWGSSHGSGSWGPGDNSIGGKALVMAGGTLVQRGNNTDSWSKNGIVENPNRSDALVVSNGYSVIEQTYQMTALPTNRLEFASLRHANRGTIRIATTDISNYEQKTLSTVSHCIVHGADAFAIGGGGADGSFAESVVPWIVGVQQWGNRIYFPYFGTRDGETDCLVLYKHPTSKASLAAATDPDENVFVHEKTIALAEDIAVNALYLNKNWSPGTALGEGRTLTVTSGGVVLEGERCAIGKESDFRAGTAGTLLLPNEGYIYSTVQSATEPNEVWASIVAPKGLAISFPGYLRLGGDQTGIDEELAINGCDVTLGSSTTGCTIDVPVRLESGAAKLRIGKAGSFCRQDLHLNDHAGSGPKFVPAAGTEEPVHKLFVNGESMPRGYYGSSETKARLEERATFTHPAFVDDEHFVGTGWIRVLTDERIQPTMLILR